eukprot:6469801-Amphidinium_carterae.2
MVWLNAPYLDHLALEKVSSENPGSILPTRFCVSIVKYQIFCTEKLGPADMTLRNQNKYSSAAGHDIRDESDVRYSGSGFNNGPVDNRTKLEPRVTIRGIHDIMPLVGLPRAVSGLADRPDLSTPATLGYSSLLLRELDSIMPDMKIETASGEYGPGSYLQLVSRTFGSHDASSTAKARKKHITIVREDQKATYQTKVMDMENYKALCLSSSQDCVDEIVKFYNICTIKQPYRIHTRRQTHYLRAAKS